MKARFAFVTMALLVATSTFAQTQTVAYTWSIARLSGTQQPVVLSDGTGLSADGLPIHQADQRQIDYAASASEGGITSKTITTGYAIELGQRNPSTGEVRVRFWLSELLRMDRVQVGNATVQTPVMATYDLDQLAVIADRPALVFKLAAKEPGRDVISLTLTAVAVKN